jgi:hypothetical protein
MLNGQPGKRILHCHGRLRQGDPLSPMLFLLAIEPLHRLFGKAQSLNLLGSLTRSCDTFRMSLYADDVVVFIKPSEYELIITNLILKTFAEASGLVTNLNKTEFFPIHCDNVDLTFLTTRNYAIASFPANYLGLPLHFRKPSRDMLQPVIQKIRNRLPGWKRGLLSYPGREALVKSVLSSLPTYFMIVFKLKKWAIAAIDKYRRSFLWRGHNIDSTRGGHCLVNWKTYMRPKK